MDNPFKKRATEYFEGPSSLISVLSPQPLKNFFGENPQPYFDRLVTIVGTPGSGKTSIARLLEFDTVVELLRSDRLKDYKELRKVLQDSCIVDDLYPKLVVCRIPTTSDLRNIWELPYSTPVQKKLLFSLIQVRAVLGWLRKFENVGIDLSEVKINTRSDFEIPSKIIHTDDTTKFRDYARNVEEKIFKIITALVPPNEAELVGFNTTYEAFLYIDSISIPPILNATLGETTLRPLFILDDAHELHPKQYIAVEEWLKSREIKVARWLMTRVDAITPETLRSALQENDISWHGSTKDRDWIIKMMQAHDRKKAFATIAKDIAKRYINQMPTLQGISLSECLDSPPPVLGKAQLKELIKSIEQAKSSSGFSDKHLEEIESWIPKAASYDEQLALFRIMIHRELKRTPQGSLFPIELEASEETYEPRKITSQLKLGANFHLYHDFDKPIFYSFDKLVDASGENIEQFIYLAGALVELIEAKVIRGKSAKIDAKTQDNTLTKAARNAIEAWNFPFSTEVRLLVNFIAMRCLAKTMEPNAPFDDGANAFGIPQSEMDKISKTHEQFTQVLHYALAYNAITFTENYSCKGKKWCLFELGSFPKIANGLTFGRGGFCEGTIDQLVKSTEK